MTMVKNYTAPLLGPLLLLLAAMALIASNHALPLPAKAVLPLAPYMLGGVVLAVALWFRRPRIAQGVAVLVLGHLILETFPPDVKGQDVNHRVVYAALAVMMPINLGLLAFARERKICSLSGLARILFLGLQALAVYVLVQAGEGSQSLADAALHARVFAKDFDLWTHLPQPALLAFIGLGLALATRVALSRQALDGGLLGAALASACALHFISEAGAPSAFWSLGAIALGVALVQDSYRMAFLDELTGLPARRALMMDLKSLGPRYTVAMLDVDHFKKFNDTYGHDVGDQVLQMVASRMAKVKGGGKAFRYGGEEFTVLFPGKSAANAEAHLDALRQAVADASFTLRDHDRPKEKPSKRKKKKGAETVSVTISIGFAEATGTPDETLKAADQALYRAKDAGRNRVSA